MKKLLIAIALALNSVACPPSNRPDPVAPRPTPIPTDVDLCDAAEANLKAMRCPEGQPTKRGTPFAMVCRELSAAGIFPNPRCLSTIKSCAEVDVCTGTTNPLPKAP